MEAILEGIECLADFQMYGRHPPLRISLQAQPHAGHRSAFACLSMSGIRLVSEACVSLSVCLSADGLLHD